MPRSLEKAKKLNSKQRKLKNALHSSDIKSAVEDFQWDVGTEGEDKISHKATVTPSFVSRIIFEWLEDTDQVLFPHGVEHRDDAILVSGVSNKKLWKQASMELKEKDKVLMPDGRMIDVDKVEVVDDS